MIANCNYNKQLTLLALVAVVSHLCTQVAAFSPIVNTGVSELSPEGRHVAVDIPGIFKMALDTRGPQGSRSGARLTETVLSGLVNILIDRERDPTSTRPNAMRGPIQVKVMGMTMYDNGAQPLSTSPLLPSAAV